MTDNQLSREGGCLCGAVRYRCRGEPLWVAHCHCNSCRRACGSVVLPWAGYDGRAFAVIKGEPHRFQSSPGAWRQFCPSCGTPLTYQSERYPDEVHITVGSLDNPEEVPPRGHVFTEEQISWLHIEDGLPRFAKTGRDED